ncbi:MAG TPA: hypothetical protein ENG79_04235 [Desulfobacteraceae bacterium]|nr:hypothetical protein [Desulfobacteraceae bacterium]
MTRIGRNEPCPCGSGRKYKKCCLPRHRETTAASPMRRLKISLLSEIGKIQDAARRQVETVRELGVFILFADKEGNAWLLEITESDAVQLARAGQPLDVPVNENPDTIEINWSHTFTLGDRNLLLNSYADGRETCLGQVPTRQINAAIRRIRGKYSPDQLNRVHIDSPAAAA